MTPRPLAVVVGFIAKSSVAGMTMYNLHYIAGLKQLGYDVHYLEVISRPDECYDLEKDVFSEDCSFGLKVLRKALEDTPLVASRWTVVDRTGAYYGASRVELCKAIDRADFVLTLADPAWHPDLDRCPRRAFLDGDPLFTQVRMLEEGSQTAVAMTHYPVLFTYWMRQGAADTTVPGAGREWISTTPAVATEMWTARPPCPSGPVTTVMNWEGLMKDLDHGGMTYGKKDRSFMQLIDLPSKTDHVFSIALGGHAPRDQIRAHGWNLVNPTAVTGSFSAYCEFIEGSYADFGVAKDAYVKSRSGWFSDRSLCYLASGRPVLHQDTGFQDWLPSGKGVIPFANVEQAVEGLKALDMDYREHARASRGVAEDHFEARNVIGRMLDQAGFR